MALRNLALHRTRCARPERIERRGARRYTWYGALEGVPEARFIIVVEQEAAATIIDSPNAESFRIHIRYLGEGMHLAYEIDSTNERQCDGAPRNNPSLGEAPAGFREPEGLPSPSDSAPSTCQRADRIIDVIILYTIRARDAASAVNGIRSQCLAGVAWTSRAYARSGIPLQMRLVGAFETSYNECTDRFCTSTRSTQEMLNELTPSLVPTELSLQALALREDYRADLVALWHSGCCGLGWCCAGSSGRAYSVVGYPSAVTQYQHAHETGHNLGCSHNPENADCDGCFSNSHGHRFIGDDDKRYITIMSYFTDGGDWDSDFTEQIVNFSNPLVYHQGQPTGTDHRNCAATIRARMAGAEGFTLTRLDVWVDFDYTFFSSGSFEYPYDSVTAGAHNIATIYDVGFVPFPTLHVKAGSTDETLTINKRMRIEPCGGPVRLGGSW